MLPPPLLLLCFTAITSTAWAAKDDTSSTSSTSFSTISQTSTPAFTGSQYSYASLSSQITVSTDSTGLSSLSSSASLASNASDTSTSTTHSLTILGASSNAGSTSTGTATTSSASATNTVPCNGYPEFCNRQYSNITQVCAHNSAFSIKNNAASNQALPIFTQLDDGIRMIQGETHYVNDTIYNCHTSCDLLNAGTWQAELETVVDWLERNPYDVVTWLIVNSDFVSVDKYLPAIEASGIRNYLYEPTYIPQHLTQWPTLAELILTGKRVVMFMDYNANQTAVPYILDEFTHMWETPFSPTNDSFPCTTQRPPGINQTLARTEYMYLANHNLNTEISLAALTGGSATGSILIPNTADINQTNGNYNQLGQAEATRLNCTAEWSRPPNFLLVDYYNLGDPTQGSVFEVAARANNVTYNGKCCGSTTTSTSDAPPAVKIPGLGLGFGLGRGQGGPTAGGGRWRESVGALVVALAFTFLFLC